MKAPEFKPLPSFGGSIEDRLARTPAAKTAMENTKKAKEEELSKRRDEALKRQRAREAAGISLTPDQIKNWRRVLFGMVGPWALIMPEEDIQAMLEKIQRVADNVS